MTVETLIDAFARELDLASVADHRFGNPTAGASDGVQGVQWNTWISTGDDAAYLSVNLEGMKYDGWPIARFIEREFRRARLFEVRAQCTHPEGIHVIFRRDAW